MLEREVENVIEQHLRKNKWIVDVGFKNRKVYRQSPRTEEERNKLLKDLDSRRFPDFILYESNKVQKPIAIIETKRSEHKNLEDAKEQGMKYAKKLGAKFLFLYNFNRYLSYYVPNEKSLLIDNVEVNNILPLSILKKFTSNELKISGTAEIRSKSDLINLFRVANNKLREAGVNAGVTRFSEFSNLLFLKLVSDLNEERNYNIKDEFLWDTYKTYEGNALINYINNTVIDGLNKKFDSSEEDNGLFTPLHIKDPIKLKEIVDKLDTLNFKKIDTDIKGDAFEYFIQKYNQTNNDLGEYFTPRHIVRFLNDIVKPTYGDKIYDPFCGTGGMLIVAFERILNELEERGKLDEDTLTNLREQTIWGGEISDTARIAKMNMILSGDGHSNIMQHDSFMNPVSDKYNIVISNIPFNMEVTNEQSSLYEPDIKKGNAVAILHILKALKNNNPYSRAAIIVPDAVLNDKSMKDLRKNIVSSGQLLGIVSLPSKVFLPYTEAKTSILIFGSKTNIPTENIFVYKVKNDGYTLTTRRRKISGINDLDNFISIHEEMLETNYNKKLNYDNLFYISRKDILDEKNKSLLLTQYHDEQITGYIRLSDILEQVKEKNTEHFETASITNAEFWGMPLGEELWGENFISVTSENNINYNVVREKYISFNPSRANVGSFGINMSNTPVAVSNAYPTFRLKQGMESRYLMEYIYLQLTHNSRVIEDIAERSYGTIRQALNATEFLKLQIKDISFDEQQKIVNSVEKKHSQVLQIQKELNNLNLE